MRARLYTDGGARGNPGPAAFGYVLEADDGTVLAAHGEAIGVATNNVAEYRALVAGGIVAATHHYWSQLHTLKQIISALVATILWPLILAGVNLHFH